MKSQWIALSALGLLAGIVCLADDAAKAPAPAARAIELKTLKDKVSYAIGANIGANMKSQGVDIDLQILLKGMQDALTGAKPLLSQEDSVKVMQEFQKDMRLKADERRKASTTKNKDEGSTFLAENGKKPGVVTLPSGLQYKVLTDGAGPKPKATDTVVTHYRGTLIDGTEFDSSYSRNEPASFPVNGVIKGWTEALQLMGVGSKWQLFVPSELAYGETGAGEKIGPNATLVFEVELLSIQQ